MLSTRKLTVLPLLFLAAGAFIKPAAAAPTIDCEIPLDVVCTVSDPAGISRVKVTLPTGFGPVVIVDKILPVCRSSTTVSWDPIVPGFDIDVTNCEDKPGGKLTFAGRQTDPLRTHRFVVNNFADSRSGEQRVQAAPASRSMIELLPAPDGRSSGTLFCDDAFSCDIVAEICDSKKGVGTCYDDHCECEIP